MAGKIRTVIQKIFGRRKLLVLIVVAVVVVGYFVRKSFFASTDGFEEAKVERGTVREELVLSGEIKAEEYASLSFLTSGELDYVGVTEGQEVEKGDVLARLNTTILYQTYLSAEADLRRYDASRDKTYDDVQGHEKDESYTQIESRTIAETNRDKAYRAYVAAQQNLAYATLRAPFDGVVTGVTHPLSGVNASLTETQIEVVNPMTLYFDVSADQTEVTDIKLGQKVNIVLDSFPEKEMEGEVSYIGYTPKSGEIGTVYEIKVKIVSEVSGDEVRVGMSGDAKFTLSEKRNVLYIPTEFVNTDIKGKYVNLGKKKNKKYIEIGIEGEESVEIFGDIKEGDTVYD